LLPSGERKTAVFERITSPVLDWEKSALAKYGIDFDAARLQLDVHTDQLKELKKQAARAKTDAERDGFVAAIKKLCAEAPAIRPRPAIIVQDITPEALGMRMASQGGRAAIFNDEGGLFGLLAGRYSINSFPNLDLFLKGHAGSKVYVDRVGR